MTTAPNAARAHAVVPASLGRRLVAWLIDAALAILVGVIAYGLLIYLEIGSAVRQGSQGVFATLRFAMDVSFEAIDAFWWIFLIAFILTSAAGAVLAVMGGGSGQTPGRRVMGVHVTDSFGQPLGAARALGRAVLFNVFLYLPIIGWALTIVSVLTDPARRSFYDRAVNAHVIGDDPSGLIAADHSYRSQPVQRVQAITAAAHSQAPMPAEPDLRDTAASPLVRSLNSPPRPSGGEPAPLPSWLERPAASSVPPPPGPIGGAQTQVPDAPPPPEPLAEPSLAEQPVVEPSLAPPPVEPAVAEPLDDGDPEVPSALPGDVEMTRLVTPGQATQEHRPGSGQPVRARVQVSDGQTVDIRGTTLVGRNPTPRPGERAVTLLNVQDPGRSVSKTHLALGLDDNGMWVADRGSTNGSLVTLPDGQRIVCFPEQPIRLSAGASVHLGKVTITVLPM